MSTENATIGSRSVKIEKELYQWGDREDVLDLCRLCMERHKNMKDIFTEEQRIIIERIRFCTGLQLTKKDCLPVHICDKCMQDLAITYNFITRCLKTNEQFEELVSTIKTENKEHTNEDLDDHFNDVGDKNDSKEIYIDIEVPKPKSVVIITKLSKNRKSLNHKLPQNQQQINFTGTKNSSTEKNVTKNVSTITARAKTKKPSIKSPKSIKKREKSTKNTKKSIKNTEKSIKKTEKSIDPSNFSCIECNINYTCREELRKHKKKVHVNKEIHTCEVCGKSMTLKSLKVHVKSHYPPQFACDICDFKTSLKHNLKTHKWTHSDMKKFRCEHCGTAFHQSQNLRQHVRVTHEKAPKPYQCDQCDQRFYTGPHLRRHIDSHNNTKRYECEVCHSRFIHRASWRTHLLKQHGVELPRLLPGRQVSRGDSASESNTKSSPTT